MPEPHRFTHNHRKCFQFKNGGIAANGLASFFLVAGAPVNIFQRVAVSDCARRMVMFFLQPKRQPFPCVKVTLQCEWTFAMPLEILRHPDIPAAAFDFTGVTVEFLSLKLRPHGARFDSLAGIVCPKTDGFVAPYA